MRARTIVEQSHGRLNRLCGRRWFPPIVGSCAFVATATTLVPVELLIVTTVLMNPRRWLALGICSAIGSTLAASALYYAFHHLGWELLISAYPDLANSKAWIDATNWLSRYGAVALFALMAFPLPIPKLPALAFAGIYRLPVLEVIIAIGLGKLLKYNIYAATVSRFPGTFEKTRHSW